MATSVAAAPPKPASAEDLRGVTRRPRRYHYAPHRVWVQRPPEPPADAPAEPSWGYFGEEKVVGVLAASLDDEDMLESTLKKNLLLRQP